MDAPQESQPDKPLVYGFLCEQTNVFYAFETYHQYQEFLSWLQSSTQNTLQTNQNEMISDE